MLPVYKQKFKQEVPVTHSVEKWSSESHWNMFPDSPDNIDEQTTSITGFIRKRIGDVVLR